MTTKMNNVLFYKLFINLLNVYLNVYFYFKLCLFSEKKKNKEACEKVFRFALVFTRQITRLLFSQNVHNVMNFKTCLLNIIRTKEKQ